MDEMKEDLKKVEAAESFRKDIIEVIGRKANIYNKAAVIDGYSNKYVGTYSSVSKESFATLRKSLKEKETAVREYLTGYMKDVDPEKYPDLARLVGVKEVAVDDAGNKHSTMFERPTIKQHLEPIEKLERELAAGGISDEEKAAKQKELDERTKRLGERWRKKLEMDRLSKTIQELKARLRNEIKSGGSIATIESLQNQIGMALEDLGKLQREYAGILLNIENEIRLNVSREVFDKHGISVDELRDRVVGAGTPGATTTPGGAPGTPGATTTPGGTPGTPGTTTTPGGAPGTPGATTTPGGTPGTPGTTTTPGGTPGTPGTTTTPGGTPGTPGATTTPGGAPGTPGATTTPGGAPGTPGATTTPGGAPGTPGATTTPGGAPGTPGTTTTPGGAPGTPGATTTPGGAPGTPGTTSIPVAPGTASATVTPMGGPATPGTGSVPAGAPAMPSTGSAPREVASSLATPSKFKAFLNKIKEKFAERTASKGERARTKSEARERKRAEKADKKWNIVLLDAVTSKKYRENVRIEGADGRRYTVERVYTGEKKEAYDKFPRPYIDSGKFYFIKGLKNPKGDTKLILRSIPIDKIDVSNRGVLTGLERIYPRELYALDGVSKREKVMEMIAADRPDATPEWKDKALRMYMKTPEQFLKEYLDGYNAKERKERRQMLMCAVIAANESPDPFSGYAEIFEQAGSKLEIRDTTESTRTEKLRKIYDDMVSVVKDSFPTFAPKGDPAGVRSSLDPTAGTHGSTPPHPTSTPGTHGRSSRGGPDAPSR